MMVKDAESILKVGDDVSITKAEGGGCFSLIAGKVVYIGYDAVLPRNKKFFRVFIYNTGIHEDIFFDDPTLIIEIQRHGLENKKPEYMFFGNEINLPRPATSMLTMSIAEEFKLKTNNKTMTIAEKFKLIFKQEPEKTFIKAGILNADGSLNNDGKELFTTFLLNKFGNDFKKEVVDPIVEEDKENK